MNSCDAMSRSCAVSGATGAAGTEPIVDNLNVLIRRVSGASMEEIDRVILELQGVREMLRSEGERVGREIAGYASLSHAAMTAMKVIGDSLTQWKNAPSNAGDRPAISVSHPRNCHRRTIRRWLLFLRRDLPDDGAGCRFDQQNLVLRLHEI